MDRLKRSKIITKEEFLEEQEKYAYEIKTGKIFIYPTDTIYGIGCNALLQDKVEKIREIKNRPFMPFSIIVPNKQWIYDNCVVNDNVEEWLKKLPGRYTLILKLKNKILPNNVNNGWDTIGVRMINHWFQSFVEKINIPIITTSVNKSGEEFIENIHNLNDDFMMNVDFIIDEGVLKNNPSTIVDLTKEKPDILER